MYRYVSLIVLASITAMSVTGLCQQPAATEELSLDRAVALALERNRAIQMSTLDTRNVEDKLAATRTRRLPAFSWYALTSQRVTGLDFRFPAGAFGQFPGIGPVPAGETSIHEPKKPAALLIGKIDQPLSQQYQIGLNLRAIELERDIAAQQERAQRQAVVSRVKEAYYGILQTQSALEAIEESIRLYKELDRVTEQYVLQQVALKSDSLEIKTRLAKAEYDALTLHNPLETQKEELNHLLGQDLKKEFRVVPMPELAFDEGDLAETRQHALRQRPELIQARLKAQQANCERRAQKAGLIPDVSLNFTYLSLPGYGSLVPSNIAGIGLLFNWEPFDWGRKRHELAAKGRVIEQADLALKEAEDQVAIEVGSKFRKLQECRQLLAVARLAQETAHEKLRVATNIYQQQASLAKDVLQLQASMAEADGQYRQALASFWSARADFEKSKGEDP